MNHCCPDVTTRTTVVDGTVFVVVGTCSQSEGVHRRPSEDALGLTKLRAAVFGLCCCNR